MISRRRIEDVIDSLINLLDELASDSDLDQEAPEAKQIQPKLELLRKLRWSSFWLRRRKDEVSEGGESEPRRRNIAALSLRPNLNSLAL